MTDEERITQLEFIINEINGTLCQYCNEVNDPYEPPDQWNAGVKAAFKGLCDAYNLWYKNHDEIGNITMKWFGKYAWKDYVLGEIARGRYSSIEGAIAAAKEATK